MIEYGEMLVKIRAGKGRGVGKAIGNDFRKVLEDLKKELVQKMILSKLL
jgi:hypothetical protein